MSTTIGRLENTGDLKIMGEVNNRLPSVKNGLNAYFPFDGTLNHYKSIKGLKVLEYHSVTDSHSWLDVFTNNGASVTNTTDMSSISVATALTYDVILVDNSYGGISTSIISKLKEFVDAGVSCIGSGNDTRTNIFVSAYNQPASGATHNIIIDKNSVIKTISNSYTGSGDLWGGITALNNGAKPFYRRSDTNLITGYIYESPISDAVFIFDLEGNITIADFMLNAINYAISKSNGNITGSNYNLTNDGIYLEESITNLWNGYFHGATSGDWSVIDNPFPSSPFPMPNKVIKCTPRSIGNYYTISSADGTTYPTGTVFTFQAWVFVDKDCDCIGSIRICGESVTSCTISYDKTKRGTWQYLEVTVTSTGVGYYFLLYPNTGTGSNTWTKGNVYFANVQLEKENYSKSYTETTKPSSSNISIPLNLGSEFTLFYKFKQDVNWAVYYNKALNIGKDIFMIYDKNTGTFLEYFDYITTNTNLYTNPGMNFDHFTTPTMDHWHVGNLIYNKSTDYWFALTKSGQTWTIYRLSETGYQKASKTTTLDTLLNFTPNQFILFSSYNWRVKDLAFYDRALTEAEILKLANGRFSMLSTGDLIVEDTDEYLTDSLPADAFYYPLDFDSKDITKTYGPSEEVNTVYEDGAVWTGNGVANYAINGNAETGDLTGLGQPGVGATGTTVTIISDDKYSGNYCVKLQRTGDTTKTDMSHYYGIYNANTFGSVSGISVIVSAKVKANRPGINIGIVLARSGGNWQGKVDTIVSTGEWQNISAAITFDTSDTNVSTSRIHFADHTTSGDGDYILIDEWMFAIRSFLNPYTFLSRGDSSLEFNLYSSIGLDWSKDWTIVYWKKPIASFNMALTGFNLESLGCNSNSVGGSYIYWGKSNLSDSIVGSIPTVIIPSEYFNHWRMISLQKSGTSLAIKEWSQQGVTVRTQSISPSANAYVTQYGYDLKLSGWDNGNICNNYYKDLVVVKDRCMPDADIEQLWKRKMKQHDKTLYLQGQMQENILPL